MPRARLTAMLALSLLFLLFLGASGLWAKPVTPEQAQRMVETWRTLESRPLGAALGRVAKDVQTFADDSGNPLFYAVFLDPAGIVFVPADDLVEPIIAFSSATEFKPHPENHLWLLLRGDLAGRLALVRGGAGSVVNPSALSDSMTAARQKWSLLESVEEGAQAGLNFISQAWVEPFINSWWGQSGVLGQPLYNYYTPYHYPCGCTATALAQILRYHQRPNVGVGTPSFYIRIFVNGQWTGRMEKLRGGDGLGGVYKWHLMPPNPFKVSGGITLAQRQAIGALTHDTGTACHMDYAPTGSGAGVPPAVTALKQTFKFTNAMYAWGGGATIPLDKLNPIINPNLDARLPVFLAIGKTGSPKSHHIICDGYGYDASTMYHHLNLGWSGNDDAWYHLPTIDTSSSDYDTIDDCIYNIFVSGTGEIISGRVTDGKCTPPTFGAPLYGAKVTATRTGGGVYTATSDAHGIYALKGVPANSTFTLTVSKAGYSFAPQTIATGKSAYQSTATGNRWGINFIGNKGSAVIKYKLYNLATSGKACIAYALNSMSQVVGGMKIDNSYLNFTPGVWQEIQGAFQYQNLGTTTLGGQNGELHGINDNGLAVGWAWKAGGSTRFPCYAPPSVVNGVTRWTLKELPSPHSNTNGGYAMGVNKNGKIVGHTWYYPPAADLCATYWPSVTSQPLKLGAGTGSPCANGINDYGYMVGVISDKAVQWKDGVQTSLDTNILSGRNSNALGLSNLNPPTIVGSYTASGKRTAAILSKSGATLLGSLGGDTSTAYAVNKYGVIVGQATNCTGYGRAFIYDKTNGMRDLNTLVNAAGWILNTAYDINDKGEIVGWGWYNNIFQYAFLLRPVQ